MKRLLLLLAIASRAAAQNTCVECHDGPQAPVEKSAHPQLSCTDCHNGDSAAAEMEASHSAAKKFIGKPKAAELATMCGDCHKQAAAAWLKSPHREAMAKGDPAGASCAACHTRAADPSSHAIVDCGDADAPSARLHVAATCAKCHSDAGKMTRSGLRIDAVDLYTKSPHGHNVLEEKASDGASCIDCHAPHESLRSTDPSSGTHPVKQAETCGRCHGDEKVMKPHQLSHGLVAKFKGSPHARGLADGAPSCAGCHGPHRVRVPALEELSTQCGACHEGPARELAAGPHGNATWTDPRSGVAEPVTCESCHGAHGAGRPQTPWAAKSCGKCHEAGTPALAAGERLYEISAATRADLFELHGLLDRAKSRGHDFGQGCEALSALDGMYEDLAAHAHGVRPETNAKMRESFVRDASALKAHLAERAPEKRSIGWLPWMWAFLFAGVGLMWLKSRRVSDRHG